MAKKRTSILMKMDHCLICNETLNLHIHEVFFGRNGNRDLSIREGLCVSLCPYHHNASNHGVHLNRELDLKIKCWAEKKWLEHNNKTIDDFRALFGKNYIDEEEI